MCVFVSVDADVCGCLYGFIWSCQFWYSSGRSIIHVVDYNLVKQFFTWKHNGVQRKTAIIWIPVCLVITCITCKGIHLSVHVYHLSETEMSSFEILSFEIFGTGSTGSPEVWNFQCRQSRKWYSRYFFTKCDEHSFFYFSAFLVVDIFKMAIFIIMFVRDRLLATCFTWLVFRKYRARHTT